MKLGEIAGKMLGSNGVIGAMQGIFHIAKQGIDSVKCRMFYILGAAANNMNLVLATDIDYGVKTRQSIANHRAARQEMTLAPLADLLALQPDHNTELHL